MLFIVIAAIFYAVAVLFIAVASRHLNTNLAVGVVNTISAIIPVAIAVPTVMKKGAPTDRFGILAAVLGGICIAFFGMALSKSYSLNKVGIVVPLVFSGAIVLSTILSYFILKEKVSVLQGLGLLVILVGLGIVTYARATGR